MRLIKTLSAMTVLSLSAVFVSAEETRAEPAPAKALTDEQQLSYAIGVVFGSRLQQEAGDLDMELFEQGLRDSYQGLPLKLSDQEIKQAFARYREAQDAAREDQQKAFEQLAKANLERGQTFLSENAKSSSVVELAPGLQYEIIKEGEGAQPGPDDQVLVHFQGQLLNGQVFDSSRSLEKPVQFQVSQGPQSWVKVLPMMKPGAVWRIWVAPELGFGSGGAGPVGPNEVLEYEIELVAVNP